MTRATYHEVKKQPARLMSQITEAIDERQINKELCKAVTLG